MSNIYDDNDYLYEDEDDLFADDSVDESSELYDDDAGFETEFVTQIEDSAKPDDEDDDDLFAETSEVEYTFFDENVEEDEFLEEDEDLFSDEESSFEVASDEVASDMAEEEEDDEDLFGDDESTFSGIAPVQSMEIVVEDDDDLFEDVPVGSSAKPVQSSYEEEDEDLFEDSTSKVVTTTEPSLLLSKEEFFKKVKEKKSFVEETYTGEVDIDKIRAIYNAHQINPNYSYSLDILIAYMNRFVESITVDIESEKGRISSNTDLNSVKQVMLNLDGKNLFIDNQNHVSNLVGAFMKKINDDPNYTVDEFLSANPKELGLTLPVSVLSDYIVDARAVLSIKTQLEQFKTAADYSIKGALEKRSFTRDSLISLMQTSFSEYDLTYRFALAMSEYVGKLKKEYAQGDYSFEYPTEMEFLDAKLQEGVEFEGKMIELTYPRTYSTVDNTFQCGACRSEEKFKMNVPFVSSVYLQNEGLYLPGVNRCPNCGAINFAYSSTYRDVEVAYKYLSDLTEFLGKQVNKSKINYLKHVHTDQSGQVTLASAKPDYLNEDTVSDSGELLSAIERYKTRVKRFSKSAHIKTVNGHKTNSAKPDYHGSYTSEASLGKFLAKFYDKDSAIRNRAVSTIIYHLADNRSFGYGYYLRYSNYVRYESVINSAAILDHLKDCSEGLFQERMQMLFNAFNLYYPDGYEFTKEDVLKVRHAYSDFRNEFEYFKDLRAHYLREIENNLNDLGNLEILQISISEDVFLDFMCCDDVRDMIYKWADRMVIYSTIEEFMNLTLSSKTNYGNKFISKAYFPDEFVEESRKFFTSFGMTKKEIVSESIYPSQDIINLLTEALDLKNLYSKDRFEFYYRLNTLIDSVRNNVGVKYNDSMKTVFNNRLFSSVKKNQLDQRLDALMTHYGSSGRYYYYLEDQFSKEEIDATIKPYHRIQFSSYISKRRMNESLEEYISRITDKEYEPQKDDLIKLKDDLVDDVRYLYVGLDALTITAYSCYNFQQIKEHNVYFAGKLIIDTLLSNYTQSQIFDMLGYSKETVNGLLNTFIEEDIFDVDFEDYRKVYKFTSLLFSDPKVFNEMRGSYRERRGSLFNMSTIVGENLSDNELATRFADELNQNTSLGRASEYRDIYDAQLEYVSPEVRDEVFEYLHI